MSDEQPQDGEDQAETSAEETAAVEEQTLAVSVEFPKRRISLSCGEQNVEVEGPDDMEELSKLASLLWRLTTPPRQIRVGFAGGGSLVTEIHPGEYGAGSDAEPEDQERKAA